MLSAYFPYFEEINIGLWDCHYIYMSVYPPYHILNAWTSFYETCYVYFNHSLTPVYKCKHNFLF
jgi:hypothetical protein